MIAEGNSMQATALLSPCVFSVSQKRKRKLDVPCPIKFGNLTYDVESRELYCHSSYMSYKSYTGHKLV